MVLCHGQDVPLADAAECHADYSRFRMLDTLTTGGLAEVVADHHNLIDAIERCDLAAFEPLVERHLYGGIRRLGSSSPRNTPIILNDVPWGTINIPRGAGGFS